MVTQKCTGWGGKAAQGYEEERGEEEHDYTGLHRRRGRPQWRGGPRGCTMAGSRNAPMTRQNCRCLGYESWLFLRGWVLPIRATSVQTDSCSSTTVHRTGSYSNTSVRRIDYCSCTSVCTKVFARLVNYLISITFQLKILLLYVGTGYFDREDCYLGSQYFRFFKFETIWLYLHSFLFKHLKLLHPLKVLLLVNQSTS